MRGVSVLVCVAVWGCSSSAADSNGASAGFGGESGATGGALGTGGGVSTGGSTGSGGSPQATGGAGGSAAPSVCKDPVGPGLPAGAPTLNTNTWVDISPQGWPFSTEPFFTQGMAVDPCNPAVLYLTASSFDSSSGGLFKSTDAGSNWRKVAKTTSGVGYLDEPIRVRVDPNDTQHLYVGDGVRGSTMGFWVSTDGGENFVQPQSFADLQSSQQLFPYDVYDVAVDPTDFNHLLVAFHGAWGWTDSKWNTNSGVLESSDGGQSWIVHEPKDGWGTGHAINFLYNPALGLGDKNTWLLGTQGNGQWRTTDAGQTWTRVTDNGIQHGGGTIHYTAKGVLYATGADSNMRSPDNGVTWQTIGPGGGYNGIGSDGTNLFTLKCFGPAAFITSLESDGSNWKDFNSQQFDQGVFEMAYDATNRIVYSANWSAGILALKR